MLTPYYVTRFDCASCGTFETGTPDRPDPAATCPWCDGELITTAQCRGMTSRPLPFTSDPRIEQPISDTPVETIGDNVREKRKRNHGHRKATGRPKGDGTGATYRKGDKDTREDDRTRYLQRKEHKSNGGIMARGSSGRPKGSGKGYRDAKSDAQRKAANHAQNLKRKNGRRPADPSGGPAE